MYTRPDFWIFDGSLTNPRHTGLHRSGWLYYPLYRTIDYCPSTYHSRPGHCYGATGFRSNILDHIGHVSDAQSRSLTCLLLRIPHFRNIVHIEIIL